MSAADLDALTVSIFVSTAQARFTFAQLDFAGLDVAADGLWREAEKRPGERAYILRDCGYIAEIAFPSH